MKKFIINQDLRDGLMQYLNTKPFGEVSPAMHALNTLQEVPSGKEDVKDKAVKGNDIQKK